MDGLHTDTTGTYASYLKSTNDVSTQFRAYPFERALFSALN